MAATREIATALIFFALGCTRESAKSAPLVVVPVASSSVAAPIVSTSPPSAPPSDDAGSGGVQTGWVRSGSKVEKVLRGVAVDAVVAAPSRAVVHALFATADCSSVGGHHMFFAIEGDQGKRAYLGGRGLDFPRDIVKDREGDAGGSIGGRLVEGWFVAGLERLPSRATVGYCVADGGYDARITALIPVADRAEGDKVLRLLGP
jgi:hypothetical protein